MATGSGTTASAWATVRFQAGGTELADTGVFDTTRYIMGGTAFLGIGAVFVLGPTGAHGPVAAGRRACTELP
jgi:hypothetical protein